MYAAERRDKPKFRLTAIPCPDWLVSTRMGVEDQAQQEEEEMRYGTRQET